MSIGKCTIIMNLVMRVIQPTSKSICLVALIFICMRLNAQSVDYHRMKMNGNVKKYTVKTYSVKSNLDEIDIDELKSRESFEYYEDGRIKTETVFAEYGVFRKNYSSNSKLISIYWGYYDKSNPTIIDSFSYNKSGLLERKVTYSWTRIGNPKNVERWLPVHTYEYVYTENNDLVKIDHIYLEYGMETNPSDHQYRFVFN